MPKIKAEKSFSHKSFKLIKNNPDLQEKILKATKLLRQNPFDQSLKTHALSGQLKGKYACFLTNDMRIIFKIDDNVIHILDIGTHDEVY